MPLFSYHLPTLSLYLITYKARIIKGLKRFSLVEYLAHNHLKIPPNHFYIFCCGFSRFAFTDIYRHNKGVCSHLSIPFMNRPQICGVPFFKIFSISLITFLRSFDTSFLRFLIIIILLTLETRS